MEGLMFPAAINTDVCSSPCFDVQFFVSGRHWSNRHTPTHTHTHLQSRGVTHYIKKRVTKIDVSREVWGNQEGVLVVLVGVGVQYSLCVRVCVFVCIFF